MDVRPLLRCPQCPCCSTPGALVRFMVLRVDASIITETMRDMAWLGPLAGLPGSVYT